MSAPAFVGVLRCSESRREGWKRGRREASAKVGAVRVRKRVGGDAMPPDTDDDDKASLRSRRSDLVTATDRGATTHIIA